MEEDPWGGGNAWSSTSNTAHDSIGTHKRTSAWSGSLGFQEADVATSFGYETAWPSQAGDSGWGASLEESGLETATWSGEALTLDVWKAEVEGSTRTSVDSVPLEGPSRSLDTELPSISTPDLQAPKDPPSPSPGHSEIDRAIASPLPPSPQLLPSSLSAPPSPLPHSQHLSIPGSPDAFGTFETAGELSSHAASVWTPPPLTSKLPDVTPENAWGSAWTGNTSEDEHNPQDEWEVAQATLRRREQRVPSHLVNALIDQWKEMASEVWPINEDSAKLTAGPEGLSTLTESPASVLDNFIPQMTLQPPVQFYTTHVGKSMLASLKLTKNLPMSRSSPWSHLAITKNSAAWERSVRRERVVVEEVGWFAAPKPEAAVAPPTEPTSAPAKETKLGGILSYWSKRNSVIPTPSPVLPDQTASAVSAPPTPSHTATFENSTSNSTSKDTKSDVSVPIPPSRAESPGPTSTLASRSSASTSSAPADAPPRSSLDEPEPAAPSAVSRFFNRFSRARTSAPRHTPLSLSASDMSFLSDIPTFEDKPGGGDDDDSLFSLQQMLNAKPQVPTKLPPPLAPPPKSAPRAAPPASAAHSRAPTSSSATEDTLWDMFGDSKAANAESPPPPLPPPKPVGNISIATLPPRLPPPLSPSPASSRGSSRVGTPVTAQFPSRSQTPVLPPAPRQHSHSSSSLAVPPSPSSGSHKPLPPQPQLPSNTHFNPSFSMQSAFDNDDGFGDFGDFMSSGTLPPKLQSQPQPHQVPPPKLPLPSKRSSMGPEHHTPVPLALMSSNNSSRRPSAPALLPPPLPPPRSSTNTPKLHHAPASISLVDFSFPEQQQQPQAKTFPAPQGLPASSAAPPPRPSALMAFPPPLPPPQPLSLLSNEPTARTQVVPPQPSQSSHSPQPPRGAPPKASNVLSAQDLSFFEGL
ncbi:hypothetical protein BOTBODRAFT_184739 [Botryobasidium botryosum FD-172 SS1]|uniref:Uncharacterized protein n=1 Tax=Botryobasidium botryosum (strain FD-172 SS1) TaxID=930990 RepID=A0A067N581_BOTB1|nr:hypothetical protein BOTBODRAFT_184739 [Botryobasidium botryosum FD-172 SS1]